ncbi:hypothetical protein BKA66DRAFT_225456 [Pyrenochaeta sp. MPI-SDFR-AT-0127]|nr:hypothetical protein BKA66DRAFT_225456 [Pyrenochaeta sp. MPI-SDFR-AT-0127]
MHLIRRTQPTSDVTPPWAGMSFTQPVDSDALHERLKKAYPTCATLRQRKHMAAIDFLTTELREMQSKDQNVATTEHSADYPALASSEAPSIFSETLEGGSRQGSPSVLESPASSAHHSRSVERVLQRQDSPPASAHLVRTQPSTTGSGQHIVFSAKDGRTLQPKLKRKMTTEEKTAYKETRKRGACPKCKRQKGKCTHTVDTSKDPGSSEDVKRPSKR